MEKQGAKAGTEQDGAKDEVLLEVVLADEGEGDHDGIEGDQYAGGLGVGEAEVNQQVVDVAAVGHKGGVAAVHAGGEDAQGVEQRDDDDGHGYDCDAVEVVVMVCAQPCIGGDKLNDKGCSDGAEHQGTGIAHKGAGGRHDVVAQKGEVGGCGNGSEYGEGGLLGEEEPNAQSGTDQDANTCRKAIDAVDEVEGIHDDEHGEAGDDEGKPVGEVAVETQQAVHVFYADVTGVDDQKGGDHLGDQLLFGVHGLEVVFEAYDEDDEEGSHQVLQKLVVGEGDPHEQGNEYAGKNTNATQGGGGDEVRAALAGHITEVPLIGDFDHRWDG